MPIAETNTVPLASTFFYQKGINAGTEDNDEQEEDKEERFSPKDSNFTSKMKRNAVYSMSVPKFLDLIAKIKSVHASMCSTIPDSYKIPKACSVWTNREVDKRSMCCSRASILGNLEKFGVLKGSCLSSGATSEQCDCTSELEMDADVPAVVEFGAGRGYLTQVLAHCYGIKKVLLVERESYKLKITS